jgi:Protein of unknown function (DUF2442)
MTIIARPKSVRFDDDTLWVDIDDGRTLGVPIVWFPFLFHAAPEERAQFTISPVGIHWENLNEDISLGALLEGHGDMTRRKFRSA